MLAEALPLSVEVARRPGTLFSRQSLSPAWRTRGREWDLSGFLALHPMPLPCSKTPAESARPRPWRSRRCCPRTQHAEGLRFHMISRLAQGFSIRCLRFKSGVAAAPARLASGWRAAPLPGGGRTLWIASKGFRLHPSSFPGLFLTQVGFTLMGASLVFAQDNPNEKRIVPPPNAWRKPLRGKAGSAWTTA